MECTILSEGLAGPWLIHDITADEVRSHQGSPWTAKLSYNNENRSWDAMPLPTQFPNGCIIRARELFSEYKWVALLQPLMRLRKDPYETTRRRGEMHGIPLAVVASHNRKTWEWKDVREWQPLDPFPVFREEYLLIS
jgi:hypothetical protein